MSKRPIAAITADFSDVLALLKEREIVPKAPPAAMLAHAKTIHAATYSLILWRFRLRGLHSHGKAFVEEIASDALQVLPQVLMGYSKTTKLLIRGILENTFRHIYFSDHPIEFDRMNREIKWFLTADQLFDYVKIHPDFLKTEPKFNAIAQMSSLYSELSAGIHGRRVQDLEMRIALGKITYDESTAKKDTELLQKCAQAANFLIAIFHRKKMRVFQADDRNIIL